MERFEQMGNSGSNQIPIGKPESFLFRYQEGEIDLNLNLNLCLSLGGVHAAAPPPPPLARSSSVAGESPERPFLSLSRSSSLPPEKKKTKRSPAPVAITRRIKTQTFQQIEGEEWSMGNGDDESLKKKKVRICEVMKRMPSVTATGDGPNGKKIEGFLYKYTKGQVSIVCVCHGNFLSPAEFVRHAGGNEVAVANPMKHINVSTVGI